MIRCRYNKETYELWIDGHAGFAPTGEDIVCAGVTALEVALDAWLAPRSNCVSHFGPGSAYFKGNADTVDVMDCIWQGLCLISENYPGWCGCVLGCQNPFAPPGA